MARSVSWIDPAEVASVLATHVVVSRISERAQRAAPPRATPPAIAHDAHPPATRRAPEPRAFEPRAPEPATRTSMSEPRAPRPRIDPRAPVADRLRTVADYARLAHAASALWIVDRDGLPLVGLSPRPSQIPILAVALGATAADLAHHTATLQALSLELADGTHTTARWVRTRRGDFAIVMIHDRPIEPSTTGELSGLLMEALA